MNQRIRYELLSQDVINSVKTFPHPKDGSVYRIQINKADNRWIIIETGCELIAASGCGVNLRRMKLEVKRALLKLGVEFGKETRKR